MRVGTRLHFPDWSTVESTSGSLSNSLSRMSRRAASGPAGIHGFVARSIKFLLSRFRRDIFITGKRDKKRKYWFILERVKSHGRTSSHSLKTSPHTTLAVPHHSPRLLHNILAELRSSKPTEPSEPGSPLFAFTALQSYPALHIPSCGQEALRPAMQSSVLGHPTLLQSHPFFPWIELHPRR